MNKQRLAIGLAALVAPAGRVTVRAGYREGEHRLVERAVDVKAGETVDVTFAKDAR